MTGTIQQADRKGPEAPAEASVAVTVNGATRRIPRQTSIARFLSSVSLDARTVVVEHNGTILRDRDSFPSVMMSDGDTLEIVHFVGGG